MRPLALAAAAGLSLLAGCSDVAVVPVGPALLISSAPAANPARVAEPSAVPDAQLDAALNAVRREAGLTPATPNARLTAAAQGHAEDMARTGHFDHTSADGRRYDQRIRATGYQSCHPAENLAWGQASPAQAVAEWRGSPGHMRNMTLPGRVEYGFGRSGNIYVLVTARVC